MKSFTFDPFYEEILAEVKLLYHYQFSEEKLQKIQVIDKRKSFPKYITKRCIHFMDQNEIVGSESYIYKIMCIFKKYSVDIGFEIIDYEEEK